MGLFRKVFGGVAPQGTKVLPRGTVEEITALQRFIRGLIVEATNVDRRVAGYELPVGAELKSGVAARFHRGEGHRYSGLISYQGVDCATAVFAWPTEPNENTMPYLLNHWLLVLERNAPNFAITRWRAGVGQGLDFVTTHNGFGSLRIPYEPGVEFFEADSANQTLEDGDAIAEAHESAQRSWSGPSPSGHARYISQLARFIEFLTRMERQHWVSATNSYSSQAKAIARVHQNAHAKAKANGRSAGYPAGMLAATIADPYGGRVPVTAACWAIAARDLISPREFATAFGPFAQAIPIEHLEPDVRAAWGDPRPYAPNGESVVQFFRALKTFLPDEAISLRERLSSSGEQHAREAADAVDHAQTIAERLSRKRVADAAMSVADEVVIVEAMAWSVVNDRIALAMLFCKNRASLAALALTLRDVLSPDDFSELVAPFAEIIEKQRRMRTPSISQTAGDSSSTS